MALTQNDIKKIESLINRVLTKKFGSLDQKVSNLDKKIDKKTDMLFGQIGIVHNQIDALGERTSVLEDKINLLPTKDEFFTKMDEVMGELKTMREEDTVLGYQVSDHEKRIIDLEENQKSGHFAVAP